MEVLSLFDGMSCGQIALRELGITPRRYYASEIDKHAIAQTQLNFPDTVQVGDVTRWREWPIEWGKIDLLLAGSPCQGFSFAGKQLAFDDPRSALFFVFIDILNHIRRFNPAVKFLLENVNMKREHMRVINEYIGVFPVNVNSKLVSAQNRDRWYWSNIRTKQEGLFGEVHTDIPQPDDREILLRDILEDNVIGKYFLSDKAERFVTDTQRMLKRFTAINGDKSLPLMARSIEGRQGTYICISSNQKNATVAVDKSTPMVSEMGMGGGHVPMIYQLPRGKNNRNRDVIQLNPSTESGGTQPYQQNRVYDTAGKYPALMAEMSCGSHAIICHNLAPRSSKTGRGGTGHISRNEGKSYCIQENSQANGIEVVPGTWRTHNDGKGFRTLASGKGGACVARAREEGSGQGAVSINGRVRRLTPTECARLQTIPDWYIWKCSETQQYKMLGNGWTVEVIKHILSFIEETETFKNIRE